MATILIDTPNGPIDALLSLPPGPGPWPGVVVAHDAFGYGPDKEATNARIARAGYLAITPNLYARGGRARCVARVIRGSADAAGPLPRRPPGRPRVASFGARDPLGFGALARLRAVTEAKGLSADIKVYRHAGHGFANELPAQPLLRVTGFGHDRTAAEDAWSRVCSFFRQHLGAASQA